MELVHTGFVQVAPTMGAVYGTGVGALPLQVVIWPALFAGISGYVNMLTPSNEVQVVPELVAVHG